MNKISKIVVVLLISILALTACTTTKAGENQLIINKKIVSFDLVGGEYASGEFERADAESKDKTLDSVTLPDAEKKGATFLGWKESGVESDTYVKTVVKAEVKSPRFYTAGWDDTFSININLDGGEFVKEVVDQDGNITYEKVEVPSSFKYNSKTVIAIPTPVKKGYEFAGWEYKDGEAEVVDGVLVINTATSSDISIKALWNIITYSINYIDPGRTPSDYPSEEEVVEEEEEEAVDVPSLERKTSYTVLDDVVFPVPERKGYTFLGWAEVPENIDESKLTSEMVEEAADPYYSIPAGTTGDKVLVPLWERNTYKVEYLLDGGKLEETNCNQYLYGGEGFDLHSPVKAHYVFSGWMDKSEGGKLYLDRFDDTTLDRNVVLSAVWTPEEYEITYDLNGGEFEGVYPSSYTYETETFTLPVPVKDGYKFTGWSTVESVEYDPVLLALSFTVDGVEISVHVYETKLDVLLPLNMKEEYVSAVERYLESQFTGSKVTTSGNIISVDISDGSATPVEDALKNAASQFGLVLEYEKTKDEEVLHESVSIYRGSYGDRSYKANWEIIVYSINYAEGEEYGPRIAEVIPENPRTYTAEEVVEIRNVEKFGYDFMGWVLEDEEYTEAKMDIVLEEGSTGDRVYVPLFRLHNYSVNLDLGGGKVESESTFTIKDKDFTIGKAVREGCVFTGWLDEDGSIKKTVTVHCAKGMDVNLKAVWAPITYKITYDLNGGKLPLGSGGNPSSYDVDTTPFTLVNPTKDTYDFMGWVLKDRAELDWPVSDYTFDTSRTGDVALVAVWKEKVYSINYDLDGGRFDYDDSNPSHFTNYSEDITLVQPYRDGYTFLGWVEEGNEGNRPCYYLTIDTSEVRDDVYLKAVWKTTSYCINYNLNGGYFVRGTASNPVSYTTDDKAFILSNPVRDGYDFLGWVRSAYSDTDKPTKLMRVETKDGGALSYDALWSAKTYTITYVLDGGEYKYGNSNPETYTTDSLITLASPHKDGCTFTGWITSGDPSESVRDSVTIYPGTTGNLTFYAVYEKTLVALGEATKMQKEIVEMGKNDIPRPDWVIEAPKSSLYYYEKAYAGGSDFVENLENAQSKCRQYIASYLGTTVESLSKDINGTQYSSVTVSVDALVKGAELVEYWEDADGGVWVLMKIVK